MLKKHRQHSLAMMLVVLTAASGAAQTPMQKVRIAFDAQVAGKPFACGITYDDIGTSHARIKVRDLRFFVSQVALLTPDGRAVPLTLDQDGLWQYKNLALLDFEDGTASCLNGNSGIHTQILGTVPAGTYTGLRFTVGVPFELDHSDTASAPSPLNTTAMFWSWQDGFKFLSTGVVTLTHRNFPVDIGSTGCAVSDMAAAPAKECAHPNRAIVIFNAFDPSRDTVVFDLAKLLAGVDLNTPTSNTSFGCMSFPGTEACTAPMHALGLPFDGVPAAGQTVFTREAQR